MVFTEKRWRRKHPMVFQTSLKSFKKRLEYTGTGRLRAGQRLCYCYLKNCGFFFSHEVQEFSHKHMAHFAGRVAPEYDGFVGPCHIYIDTHGEALKEVEPKCGSGKPCCPTPGRKEERKGI